MSVLKKNTIANFVGHFWVAAMAFILVPIYIKYLGIESYGLLGFFISIQSLLVVMDFGLSVTTTREVARSASDPKSIDHLRQILVTLQYIYFGFGIFMMLVFFFSADWMSTHWISASHLSNDVIRKSIVIFGVTFGLRWPNSLYSGILRGYEKQVLINKIMIFIATLRGVLSLILVMFLSQSIIVLQLWHLLSGILEVVLFGVYAWRAVPSSINVSRKFSFKALKSVLGFSSTVALLSIFAAIIKQLDRVMISKLLSLENVGYYVTAFQAFTVIQMFINPISSAVFPRLSSLVKLGDEKLLSDVYHKTTKIIVFIVSPIAAIFIFYSYDLLFFWTRSDVVAHKAWLTLSLLSFAGILNSAMSNSLSLQLASGLQRIPLYFNIASCIILTPLTYFLVLKLGIIGGAVSLIVFNILYYSIIPIFTHRYILKNQLARFITQDTIPFIILGTMLFGLSYTISCHSVMMLKFSMMCLSFVFYVLIVIFFDKGIRGQFVEIYQMSKNNKYHL